MTLNLRKPSRLSPGDKIATVSLSWGGAGDNELIWRYYQGKERLEKIFGLEVVEMSHTLMGSDFVYHNPQKRAEDLMMAFKDPTIKGIFSCIGGDDSVRILPYIDFSVIRNNPKIFLGYSDTTITHLICLKAGLSSFYGPSLLAEFAENVAMHDYTVRSVQQALYSPEALGTIPSSPTWTSQYLPWLESNKELARTMLPNTGYEVLQGQGITQGRLIGGCLEVLEFAKETSIWPELDQWSNSILFFETSEDKPTPKAVEYCLRNYGAQGILQRAKGMIWAKPYDNQYYEEYKESIVKIIQEFNLENLTVLHNLSFGHTAPMMTLPYGALAEINCDKASFSILESGVI